MNLSWPAFLGSEEGRRKTSTVEEVLEDDSRGRLRFRVLPYKSGWLLEYRHKDDTGWHRVPRRMPSYLQAIRMMNTIYDNWRREKLSHQRKLV